jgi:hydrogenase maturation factor
MDRRPPPSTNEHCRYQKISDREQTSSYPRVSALERRSHDLIRWTVNDYLCAIKAFTASRSSVVNRAEIEPVPRELPSGKVPLDVLSRLLPSSSPPGAGVVIGPAVGEDAAVLRLNGKLLVAKSDPITLASRDLGRYLVQVNANDIAVMGAKPRWLLLTILLPSGHSAQRHFSTIMRQVQGACDEANIALVGGHSEVTDGLSRPIAVGTMLGEICGSRILDKSTIRPGDELFMTGSIAIEGTAALARDFRSVLRSRGLGSRFLRRASNLLFEPGISIVGPAEIAAGVGQVRALHDPTEGGIKGAVYELGVRSGCGILLDVDSIPILPETSVVCQALGLDPFQLLASGSMLIAAAPGSGGALAGAFSDTSIGLTKIGTFLPAGRESWTVLGGKKARLRAPDRDELARAYDLLPSC